MLVVTEIDDRPCDADQPCVHDAARHLIHCRVHQRKIWGFDYKGNPVQEREDYYDVIVREGIPHSTGKRTYLEAVQEAFPDRSKSDINRLFRDHAVKVFGYECLPDEDPDELFGGSMRFAVFRAGKDRGFLFR